MACKILIINNNYYVCLYSIDYAYDAVSSKLFFGIITRKLFITYITTSVATFVSLQSLDLTDNSQPNRVNTVMVFLWLLYICTFPIFCYLFVLYFQKKLKEPDFILRF